MPFRRTHATALTDDELILLDVMFDGGTTYQMLHREGFVEQWNYPAHDFNDDQLKVTLKQLVGQGWLETWQHPKRGQCFRLTPLGGSQWELERLPAWDRYATDCYGDTCSGNPFVTITATTEKCRDDFWRVGCEVGTFSHSVGRVRKAVIQNHSLISWKTFLAVYVVVAVLDEVGAASTDWRAFEERRTWWRSVRENDKFWQ